jgi:hypothetical protein
MLAYSSMEHMGLIAIGAAIGTPLALAAILLHIAGHGLAKAVAFTGAGHILAGPRPWSATPPGPRPTIRSAPTQAPYHCSIRTPSRSRS